MTKRTTLTWGLIAVSAAGAVGAADLAYSAGRSNGGAIYSAPPTVGFIEGSVAMTTSTTTAIPGMNGVPLRQGNGYNTKSHGS